MATQAAINSIVDQIVAVYNGHRVAFPNGSYDGECTAPVAGYYVPRVTGQVAPSMYAARADGWGVLPPYQLTNFFTHEAYQPGKAYPKGTILMWNSPHIAIVMFHNGSNTVQVFEQNADPDGSVCGVKQRDINTSTHICTYALIPIVTADIPAGPPYTVEQIPQKTVVINKDTNRWGLNHATFPEIAADPLAAAHLGDKFDTSTILHHQCGESYYSQANSGYTVANGFNIKDCDDYVAPTPQTPPAAPVTVKLAETYTVVTNVAYFDTPIAASMHSGTAKVLAPGTYYVYAKDGKAYNLTTNNVKDQSQWINIDDNVAPKPATTPAISAAVQAAAALIPDKPVDIQPAVQTPATAASVTPWKPHYQYLRADHEPVVYKSVNTYPFPIIDYSTGQEEQKMKPKSTLKIVDGFVGPDGKTLYVRNDAMAAPDADFPEGVGYGIPKSLLQEAVFDTELSRAERLALGVARAGDKAYYAWVKYGKHLDGIKSVLAGINSKGKK